MKPLYFVTTLTILILFQGCLTYHSIEYHIFFNERFDRGTITVHYNDICSSESDLLKREEDFKELVNLLFEDDFLLDNLEQGIYVKDRKLWEEGGLLKATFSGIFKDLKIDDNKLDIQNEERILFINETDVEIESNGKILKSDNNILLTWPKDQRELTWKIIDTEDQRTTYSMLDFYQTWQKEKVVK